MGCVPTCRGVHFQGHKRQRHTFVLLICGSGHASAPVLQGVPNCPRWGREAGAGTCAGPSSMSWGPPEAAAVPVLPHIAKPAARTQLWRARYCFWWCMLLPHMLHCFLQGFLGGFCFLIPEKQPITRSHNTQAKIVQQCLILQLHQSSCTSVHLGSDVLYTSIQNSFKLQCINIICPDPVILFLQCMGDFITLYFDQVLNFQLKVQLFLLSIVIDSISLGKR